MEIQKITFITKKESIFVPMALSRMDNGSMAPFKAIEKAFKLN